MEFFLLLPVALVALWIARLRHQQGRIALLARYLAGHDIEQSIETLSQGYSRALGEADPARGEQVWGVLRGTENALCREVRKFAEDFAGVEPTATRVSKFPTWLPRSPAFDRSFDMREALRMHSRGICRAVEEQDASPKDRAFAIMAEMLLMQHTCHWYCRSKSVASARMLARHRTSYEQLIRAVLPQTRQEYLGLVA
ncbi:hypothetical protein [Caenimonas aquaedulcis]|uniref:Uncharacterized protein n=1 Tax=Caenimonas aquaedulcis TaxID=2793270 RepID=A0A931MIT3_9BURK|nr:hypothetical protein [Caenimonas aquaedulcis]MBG9390481.1 hypothetical protein [Caenimonas aquaedulcis]